MKKFIKNAVVVLTTAMMACFAGCSTDVPSAEETKLIPVVSIPGKSFSVAKTETTYAQWKTVYDWAVEHGYNFANLGKEGSMGVDGAAPTENKNHPVTNVSWRDAVVWCNAVSEMEGLTPYYYLEGTTDFTDTTQVIRVSAPGNRYGTNPDKVDPVALTKDKAENAVFNVKSNGYRLPYTDEWAYVHNGGENFSFSGSNDALEVGWIKENAEGKTHPAAEKQPNKYGIYDMTGNVSEYCQNEKSAGSGQYVMYGDSWKLSQKDGNTFSVGGAPESYSISDARGFRVLKNGYIGDKAPSAAKEVGDIVFNDGSATPYTVIEAREYIDYSTGSYIRKAEKESAVAIIYYKGTKCSNDARERTLGMGLNPYTITDRAWCSSAAKASEAIIPAIEIVLNDYKSGIGNLVYDDGDKEGKDNLSAIAQFLGTENDTTDLNKYPAFEYALNYKKYTANLADISEGWYLPSAAELWEVYAAKSSLAFAYNILGLDDDILESYFWTSSKIKDKYAIEVFTLSDGSRDQRVPSFAGAHLLPIREF